jgi:hypothetical protein
MKKRSLATLLCLCMILSLLPFSALAADTGRTRVYYDANRGVVFHAAGNDTPADTAEDFLADSADAEHAVGETVKLLADTQATDLVLTKDITLDLNGHALTADYLVVFGDGKVVDTAGNGLLKCANVRLAANNPMMPVWDAADNAKGYRFFDMVKYQQYKTQDANGFVFEAKPALGKAANDPYLAAMDTNLLTVKARIYWQSNSGNEVEQLFTFKAADVEKVYQADNMVLQLTVTGAGAYAGKLWTSIRIESETGVIWEGVDAQPYTGVSGQ